MKNDGGDSECWLVEMVEAIFRGFRKWDQIKAPWTQEQVDALNRYQKSGIFHPFTCGSGRRTDGAHLDGEGILLATVDGWICPYCDYKQDWAHDFMADGSAIKQAGKSWND